MRAGFEFKRFLPSTNCYLRMRIAEDGTVLAKVRGKDPSTCPIAIVPRDGAIQELGIWTRAMLDRQTVVDCNDVLSGGWCSLIHSDGGVLRTYEWFRDVYDVTASGWVCGRQLGGTSDYVIGSPDGGIWLSGTFQWAAWRFAMDGLAVGQFSGRPAVWRSGDVVSFLMPNMATSASLADMNTHGLAVGTAIVGNSRRAAVWWGNIVLLLPLRNASSDSEALAVDDHGHVVGIEYANGDLANSSGFLWESGRYDLFDELGDATSGCSVVSAMDINGADEVAARVRCDGGLAPAILRLGTAPTGP